MTMKMVSMTMAILLAGCGSNSSATEAAQARATAKPLDVAGLTPGMSLTEARQILTQKGFKQFVVKGDSWASVVRTAVIEARGGSDSTPPAWDGIAGLNANNEGESIMLGDITPTADGGGEITRILYEVRFAGRTREQVRADVLKRYGPPAIGTIARGTADWCSAGDTCRGDQQEGPKLSYSEESDYALLRLDPGRRLIAADKARLDAAVAAQNGKPKSSF